MKVRIEAECTPEEARAFLGLPDVTALNAQMVEAMGQRLQTGPASFQPDEILRNWKSWGGQAQEQFRALMQAAVAGAATPKSGDDGGA